MRFDHLGLVVKDLGKARLGLANTLGIQEWTDEIDDLVNGVRIQFGRDRSGLCYELLEPLGADSPVAEAVRMRRTILNHVAYMVDKLSVAAEHLSLAGCAAMNEPKPAIAYGGGLVFGGITAGRTRALRSRVTTLRSFAILEGDRQKSYIILLAFTLGMS